MSDVINGTENIIQPGTARAALVDFYRAFNQRELPRMAECWLHSDLASMSNPLGGVKRGWEEIGGVYEKIFSGAAQVYVEFYDFQIYETEMMFCAAGRERGYLKTAENKIDLAIRTSRVYLNQQGRWLQMHHHGSIDQAELLARYQKAVLQQAHA
jgi:hypothetical protein